jgi:opacity protein-like surface antigen
MNRRSRSREYVLAGLSLSLLAFDGVATAADMPLTAPALGPVYSWTGFYLGGHVGYGGGSFGPDANPLPLQGVFFPHSITGLIGGYQAGYNFQLLNNLVLGVEADVSFLSTLDRPRLVPAPFNTTFDYIATARGRVGYAFGALLPYVTGGVAWARTHVATSMMSTEASYSRAGVPMPAGPRARASNMPPMPDGAQNSNTATSIWAPEPTGLRTCRCRTSGSIRRSTPSKSD